MNKSLERRLAALEREDDDHGPKIVFVSEENFDESPGVIRLDPEDEAL
jgi:hypothetical protein